MAASSQPEQSSPLWPHNRQDAQVEHIVRVLRGYRVLTETALREASGAAHWSDAGFRRALDEAVSRGRIRRLGNELYESVEHDPGDPS
jgi:hypothetical protein